jgi:phosphoribosylaminoimidazolecarboxamide formyltransferase/IMP cyclohydrolase
MLKAQRALLSVYDKKGLADLARSLAALGVELLSTGGSLRHLKESGLPVKSVAEVTGHPEILGGRVKSLHPRIHGGILADRSVPGHLAELEAHGIGRIDLVFCNLYPFEATLASGATPPEVVEMIDIGGPAMIRAAAKNFSGVAVVVDPADYGRVASELAAGDGILPEGLRRELAAKAFRHTARYDAAIASWLSGGGAGAAEAEDEAGGDFPAWRSLELERDFLPRYGENPHQAAAVYHTVGGGGLFGGMEKLHGKELSFNNLLDTDAARRTVALFAEPCCVIVKHNNPCGIGRGESLAEAYGRAFASDRVSAFGSIVAVNRTVDLAFAEASAELFIEVLTAPDFEPAALARLRAKKNLRLLRCPLYRPGGLELRAVEGGFLAQAPDDGGEDAAGWTCVTARQPSDEERAALEMAWKAARAVKSNAIVIARRDQTLGVGAGQMSRVDSCRLAIAKARETEAGAPEAPLAGAVAASDAFFPFRDGLDILAGAGIVAVVQPGGSVRDAELIAAADEKGLAMLLTGRRHFRH